MSSVGAIQLNQGPLNYSESNASQTTITNGTPLPAIVVSQSITTTGNPVQIIASGDANPLSAGGWGILKLYRDGTAIGKSIQVESSAANENVPYALNYIDDVVAGTYTYSVKLTTTSGSDFQFGENDGNHITLLELASYQGPMGPAGQNGFISGASGIVNAGTYVTYDNISVTISSSGNRSLQLKTVSGSFVADHSGNVTYYTGSNQFAYYGGATTTFTTSAAYLNSGWNLPYQGDTEVHHLHDTTNGRAYRITAIIGNSYNNNVISIERLV